MGIASRLYRGETDFHIIGKRRRFYAIALTLTLLSLVAMFTRGFNQGVEFKGGAIFQWPANGASVSQARSLFEDLKIDEPIVQTVGRGSGQDLRVQTEPLNEKRTSDTINAIQERFKITNADQIASSEVGPAWGKQVTRKALQGLVVFLIAVIIYISVRFEPKMAFASIIGLLHDLLLSAGIYAITQFVVTPATIVALLTILGFSLYDAVVVFDKVQENTRGLAGGSQQTYTEAAELALNQTFMRSINTTLIALLPVSGLLFVGAGLLGAGTLKDLSLALFVGLAAGAYSSIFLCTPLFVELKEREPQYKALTQRVLARRSGGGVRSERAAARRGTASVALTKPDQVAVADGGEAAVPVGGSVPPAQAAPSAARRPGGSANKKKGRPGRPTGKRR